MEQTLPGFERGSFDQTASLRQSVDTAGLYIGTDGWSSTPLDWMYPKSSKQIAKLHFYSQMFNSVEVDQTFYGLDCLKPYRSWLEAVPEDFRFALKTPKTITHDRKLRNPEPELSELLESARKFGDQLGPVLVQLPPSFTLDHAEALGAFLDRLPFGEMQFAVEVRDYFLWSEVIPDLMERYPLIPVTTNLVSSPGGIRTGDNGAYIRWLGPSSKFEGPLMTPERFYEESCEWAEGIRQIRGAPDSPNVYAFVDHEYFGPGVIGAARLRKLLDKPVYFPGTLF